MMELNRLKNLRAAMTALQLEAVLLTQPHNRRYMTGFTGTAGYVLITLNKAYLLIDFRYRSQAPQQAVLYEIVEHQPKPMETVRLLLDSAGIHKLGFEQQQVTYGAYRLMSQELAGIELVPTDNLVENLRVIKDDAELAVMQEAADLADATFAYILAKLKPGVTEKEIDLEMEFYMRRHGATSSSFDTIVASGERSALPHGVASDRVLCSREFVKLDFGAYYKGYCSDLTRTVSLGKPSDKHKEIYQIVLEAQLTALAGMKPGMTGREVDALARNVIAKAGYGENFGHGTGHGLGMEIHEAPRLSLLSDAILQPGMVVTVEPGIYLPGFGGVRIEDDVVMTDTGIRIMTHSDKQLITVD